MLCRLCRGRAEGPGFSTTFACAEELGVCCNTFDEVLNLRVGKTLVEAPLGFSRLDCDMEGVSHELAGPAIVTGVLRTVPDRNGQLTYAMTVSDVCTVAQ
jgi:hypothetical protein